MHSIAGKDKNIVISASLGIAVALILSFLLTVALTSLIQSGKLGESTAATGAFFIRAIATFAGVLIGTGISGKNTLPVIVAISLGYLVVLIALGIVLFDGSFQKLWTGLLSVLVGMAVGLTIKLKPQKRRKSALRYVK